MSWKEWWIFLSLWAARLIPQPSVPVTTTSGEVQGILSSDGNTVEYFGIPYASVEPGRRFQAANTNIKWEGVKRAYDENIRCIQRFTNTQIAGQEDCLRINVYTPAQQSNKLRPVMVYIHGGGFRDGSGSSALYGGSYLVQHDVILVTFNYRVEILGFLCLGIKEAPGNIGMKDQVEALKWVQRNIRAFGGDPDNVTIFGESAGSAAVVYHLVSPMSKGLFHKAIMQSGSAISPWSFQFDPLTTARTYTQMLGYDVRDPKEIYQILMLKTAHELLENRVPRLEGDVVLSENIFVPCVEKKIPGVEPFLTESPYEILTKGQYNKVPVIIGFNNAEGHFFLGKETDTTLSNLDFYKSLPIDLKFPTEAEKIETANTLKNLYMGENEISRKSAVNISKYQGEHGITFPTVITADIFARTNDKPVYTYKFAYDGWMNLAKHIASLRAPGATHADELFYIFQVRIPFIQVLFETKMIYKLTLLWTNFAKYSNPTPEISNTLPIKWPPTTKDNAEVLVIDKTLSTAPLWADETLRFWRKIYSKYRRKI